MQSKLALFRTHKYKQKETTIQVIMLIFVLWKTGLSYYFFLFTFSLLLNWISCWNYPYCTSITKSIIKKIIHFRWWILLSCIIRATIQTKQIKKTWNCRLKRQMDVSVLQCLRLSHNRLNLRRNLFSLRKNHSIIIPTKSFPLLIYQVFGNRQGSVYLN